MKRIEAVFQTERDIMVFMEQLQTVFRDNYFKVKVQADRTIKEVNEAVHKLPEELKTGKVS